MKSVKERSMQRGEFLRNLGLSSASLMAFYCLGATMSSCGSKSDDPDPVDPGTGNTTGITGTTSGNVNFTVDLTNSKITSTLGSADKFLVTGDVLIAQTTNGSYVALSKTCTHEGTQLRYRAASNDLFCSNHGSEFSTNGTVEQGPAATALKAYKTSLSADGKILTVTA